jgi:hypothetical protein
MGPPNDVGAPDPKMVQLPSFVTAMTRTALAVEVKTFCASAAEAHEDLLMVRRFAAA